MRPSSFTLAAPLVLGFLVGCGSPATHAPHNDALPGDASLSDAVDLNDGSTDGDGAGSDEPPQEAVASEIVRHCPGCVRQSWCGMPTMSDSTTLTLVPAPNAETGLLFAAERYEAAGRAVEVGRCRRYEGSGLEPVTGIPSGVSVLDGGDISLGGEVPALEQPMIAQHKTVTHNYVATARPIERAQWHPGAALRLWAAGGADLAAFSAETTASDPFELVEPGVDAAGSLGSVDLSLPMDVTWTGGSDHDDVVVLLEAMYCNGAVLAVVACRASNDGAFTIPAELLAGIDRANLVMLYLMRSRKVPLPIAELPGRPSWSVRAVAMLPVFLDEVARSPR